MPRHIDSKFALLDVKFGREAISKRLANGETIEVFIRAFIDPSKQGQRDDGTSTEFALNVSSVVEIDPLSAA